MLGCIIGLGTEILEKDLASLAVSSESAGDNQVLQEKQSLKLKRLHRWALSAMRTLIAAMRLLPCQTSNHDQTHASIGQGIGGCRRRLPLLLSNKCLQLCCQGVEVLMDSAAFKAGITRLALGQVLVDHGLDTRTPCLMKDSAFKPRSSLL